eukprot:CAMPEP_0195626084 /NCGR_PEP_ID=MMETSP0815-20121206/18197_1 /TAXON_ID=97485 /ORGANISM="Prymnesium parvum, Strain Texoma1" /LENGTH=89 /DNA_ID=CAMNT_0040767203 /DNA_START=114 /DNA_END=379 /DNA_ORIENTATION=+
MAKAMEHSLEREAVETIAAGGGMSRSSEVLAGGVAMETKGEAPAVAATDVEAVAAARPHMQVAAVQTGAVKEAEAACLAIPTAGWTAGG